MRELILGFVYGVEMDSSCCCQMDEHWVLHEPSLLKMVGVCDLLGTQCAPVSKIPSDNQKEN